MIILLITIKLLIIKLLIVLYRRRKKSKQDQENTIQERNIAVKWYREHIMSQKKDKVKKDE